MGFLRSRNQQASKSHNTTEQQQEKQQKSARQRGRRPSCLCSFLLLAVGYVLGHLDADCSMENDGDTSYKRLESAGVNEVDHESKTFLSLLTLHEDEILDNPSNKKKGKTNTTTTTSAAPNYHIIFSTGCNSYQQWQSYLLFYSAMKVRQPGHVTRIVSGCSNEDERHRVQRWFDQHIVGMSHRFHLHIMTTRVVDIIMENNDNSSNNNANVRFNSSLVENYHYFNKPFGVRDWMTEAFKNKTKLKNGDNDIIIIIDPDMIILKPLIPPNPIQPGQPVAQRYGYEDRWLTFVPNVATIVGPASPVFTKYNETELKTLFPAGPPYMATRRDMQTLVEKWCELVPIVHAHLPVLMAEMYAYSLAAAHLEMPHVLLGNLMVSSYDDGSSVEGWPWIDDLMLTISNKHEEGVCDMVTTSPGQNLPHSLHYCQYYRVGVDWLFYKGFLPHHFFDDCHHELLVEEPSYLLDAMTNGMMTKENGTREQDFMEPLHARRNTFMLCTVTRHVNDAAIFLKHRICPGAETGANYETTYKLVHRQV